MKSLQFDIHFMKAIVARLVVTGVSSMIVGVLILIYPHLLGILVGILLILTGVIVLSMAVKANKYSRFKIF